ELNPLAPSLDGLFPFQPRRPLASLRLGQENFTAMVAAIGTGGIPRPNRRLLSQAPRLPTKALPAFSKSITLRWENPADAPLTTVSLTGEGVLIETAGSAVVRVGLRQWPMPLGRGVRSRFVCPRCGSFRDALHWVGEWGCRGNDCLNLEHPCRHQQRWCPA